MPQIPTLNFSSYARKMLMDRYIIPLDLREVKEHPAQLQKIGVNVNQIAKHINETGRIHGHRRAAEKLRLNQAAKGLFPPESPKLTGEFVGGNACITPKTLRYSKLCGTMQALQGLARGATVERSVAPAGAFRSATAAQRRLLARR